MKKLPKRTQSKATSCWKNEAGAEGGAHSKHREPLWKGCHHQQESPREKGELGGAAQERGNGWWTTRSTPSYSQEAMDDCYWRGIWVYHISKYPNHYQYRNLADAVEAFLKKHPLKWRGLPGLSLVKRDVFFQPPTPLIKGGWNESRFFSCEKGLSFFPTTTTLDKRVDEMNLGLSLAKRDVFFQSPTPLIKGQLNWIQTAKAIALRPSGGQKDAVISCCVFMWSGNIWYTAYSLQTRYWYNTLLMFIDMRQAWHAAPCEKGSEQMWCLSNLVFFWEFGVKLAMMHFSTKVLVFTFIKGTLFLVHEMTCENHFATCSQMNLEPPNLRIKCHCLFFWWCLFLNLYWFNKVNFPSLKRKSPKSQKYSLLFFWECKNIQTTSVQFKAISQIHVGQVDHGYSWMISTEWLS